MKKVSSLLLGFLLFSLFAACDGGEKADVCPEGYFWNGVECEKDPAAAMDDDFVPVSDDDKFSDQGGESDQDSAIDSDEVDDGDAAGYSGDCIAVKSGGTFDINVETVKLTIGAITVDGGEGNENLFGELWAENRSTLSEFKVGDINGEFSGKTFDFPKGTYNFSFRPTSSAKKTVMIENKELSNGDVAIDLNLPLYHFTGSVQKNGQSFSVDSDKEAETFIKLKTGTYERTIPYSDFGGFDLLLPPGTYSVYFQGQLVPKKDIFKGSVLSSAPDSGIKIVDSNVEQAINVETILFKGLVQNEGYNLSTGRLVLVENPPFDDISGVVVSDLSSSDKRYEITTTKGADMNLLYLPEPNSYPAKYIKLEVWNSATENPDSHQILLDFAKLKGKITFLNGVNFPTISKCSDEDCAIGKLKVTDKNSVSLVVKNLGTELSLDDDGNVTYEAFLVRRIKVDEEQYNAKEYTMNFESHLNDVEGIFSSLPFTVTATYKNGEGVSVSPFSFSVVKDDGTIEWLKEKEIDFDVSPSLIKGKVALDGVPFSHENGDFKGDFIKLKNEDGNEFPVLNLAELAEGNFSFYAPNGTYDVVYEGEAVLGAEYKTFLKRDFEINGDSQEDFAFKTGKITLDLDVDGRPFAEWADAQENLKDLYVAVNIDDTPVDFAISTSKANGKYVANILTGATLNLALGLIFKSKVPDKKSYVRIPLSSSPHNMTSGFSITTKLSIVDFFTSVKLNGAKIDGASDYVAEFKIQGRCPGEIYYPASGGAPAFFKQGEYKSPLPELILNDGFQTKHAIGLNCVYFGD